MKDQLVVNIFGKYQIYICVMIHNIHFNLFWILILFLRPPTVIYLLVLKVIKSTIPVEFKLLGVKLIKWICSLCFPSTQTFCMYTGKSKDVGDMALATLCLPRIVGWFIVKSMQTKFQKPAKHQQTWRIYQFEDLQTSYYK